MASKSYPRCPLDKSCPLSFLVRAFLSVVMYQRIYLVDLADHVSINFNFKGHRSFLISFRVSYVRSVIDVKVPQPDLLYSIMYRGSNTDGVDAALGSMAIVIYPVELTSSISTVKQVFLLSCCFVCSL